MIELDPQFEALLVHLKETRGFDFTGYKRSTLMRRVNRRMAQVEVPTYLEYLDRLQVHPEEFTTLFNTILINVTGFFRDPDAWAQLREILPTVIAGKDPDSPLRVWSAGCASGEEAYSLAILLAELMGIEAFRQRVKIYATDVDEESLAQARQASYTEREIQGVPSDLQDKYFELAAQRYMFRKDLRRCVIFGRNDLVQDAPISRIDVLACRNTLMYFNAETQARILARFHFALTGQGVMFLGKAEMMLSHTGLFLPIDLKQRLFRKNLPVHPANAGYLAELPQAPAQAEVTGMSQLREEALAASPVAQIVLTADGLIASTNRQIETMFGLSSKDIGRPFHDLDLSYRPLELRGYLEQVQAEQRMVRVSNVEHVRSAHDKSYLDVQLNPLTDRSGAMIGVALLFFNVTATRRLHDELEHANRQLETAYEELQSTNEELETTNEELQSTVEELETTNEELQSTNEELETMNEELQSANDELRAINDELGVRTTELDQATAFVEAILTSLRVGVVVIDREFAVQIWNRQAEELWGLRQSEAVGQHFLNLDIGLPTEKLRSTIRQLLDNSAKLAELRLGAVNRRGRAIEIRVIGTQLSGDGKNTTGALLVMDPIDEPGLTAESNGG